MESINPATGIPLERFSHWDWPQIDAVLADAAAGSSAWTKRSFSERGAILRAAAELLRAGQSDYTQLITEEMGKPIREARGEIEKCAWACDFYAEHAATFLADEEIKTDASRSLVAYLPLGTVLAVMPWNFPFWQVFRFAAPTLMAGNTALLKHAANVPRCALAIEHIWHTAGLPTNVFRTLLIESGQVARVIEDARVHAVSLTGSEGAGRQVASTAGKALKKTVLELGGSDAFIVLADADLDLAATTGVAARYLNAGQSCIAAKRFILVDAIADEFLQRFKSKAAALKVGDPMREDTDLGPLARADLRQELHDQVQASIAKGAVALLGCKLPSGSGNFYPASILDRVRPDMRAYGEELFGPVAIIIRARDEAEAIRIANDNRYGLGNSLWTRDVVRGERLARTIQSGATFINGMVKSDPRLPFGGIKASGYGRELAEHGIREFVNAKTLWIR